MSKFNFVGKCPICGCHSDNEANTTFQTEKIICWGCGYFYNPKVLINQETKLALLDENNKPKLEVFEEFGYGTCITKDDQYINFKSKPSNKRIDELKDKSIWLCVWNPSSKNLDIIVGNITEDFVLKNSYNPYKYIQE